MTATTFNRKNLRLLKIAMPVRRGVSTSSGKPRSFYQWGNDPHTKKYFYTANNPGSRERAKKKAALQGRAIKASQSRRWGVR